MQSKRTTKGIFAFTNNKHLKKVKKLILAAGLSLAALNISDAQAELTHPKAVHDTCKTEGVRPAVYAALKTNVVYDAIMVPNIGVEYYLGNGYSVGGTYWYTWWRGRLSEDTQHDYWRSYGLEVNGRKYFGGQAARKPLSGQHIGLLAQGYMYDSRNNGRKGYMSDFSYNIGLEYGYSLPACRRLNIDFSIALGYVGGKYKVYDQRDGHYVWEKTRNRNFLGPVKAEITFAYQMGRDNINLGKDY